MQVVLKKVRASYLNLNEARGYEGSEPKFSASYLMAPDHPAVKLINAAAETVSKEKWGAKAESTLKAIKAAGKFCLRNGDDKESDEYQGMLFVNASSKKRPKIVDRDGVTELDAEDGKPYSGCYVTAYIDIWSMDNKYGKRICASLGAVQFHSDGEPFGGGGGSEAFAAIEDDEEESLV